MIGRKCGDLGVGLLSGLIMAAVALHPALADEAKSDERLTAAVALCLNDLPKDAPDAGFAPFRKYSEVKAVGDNTWSAYERLQDAYPKKVFQSGRYGAAGLQYYVTLAGSGQIGKQYAWTILSVPRVYKEEERKNNTLWDAAIFEASKDFTETLKAAAGDEAASAFSLAKKQSLTFVAAHNRHMAAYSLAAGREVRRTVTGYWRSLLGEWAMDQVILPTHPKKDSSLSSIGYDHWVHLHPLMPSFVTAPAKYRFVSQAFLGAVGAPAFAFSLDSDGRCIAGSRIDTE